MNYYFSVESTFRGKPSKKNGLGMLYAVCRCFCGKQFKPPYHRLLNGKTKSCGCLTGIINSQRQRKHGEYDKNGRASKELQAYQSMRARCNYKRGKDYPRYGGRGIECRFRSFEEFLAEIGRAPSPKHSVDRINNEGHYEAGNVRWASVEEQANNKRQNRKITLNGETQTLWAWCRIAGITKKQFYRLSAKGLSVEAIFKDVLI